MKGKSAMLEVVKFRADWCQPCKRLAPIIDELKQEFPDVTFRDVDVDAQPDEAAKYGVMSLPTLVFIKDGQVVDRQVGAYPKPQIVAAIATHGG